jgi:hypothetical protein
LAFVKEHHYSHTHPGGVDYSFRLDYNSELAGACLFGHMAGNPKASVLCENYPDPLMYRELMRLVLLDEVPKNSETRFIGWCLRWLRKNTQLIAAISFADPKQGHSGTIYKAGNWVYTGYQKQDRPRLVIDGFGEVHPRMCYNRWGTSSVNGLRELGLTVTISPREPKHRFVYPLRDNLTFKKRLFTCPRS